MTTNEFYYNDGKTITRDEAHELKDKSKLVVSDESKTEEYLKKVFDKGE